MSAVETFRPSKPRHPTGTGAVIGSAISSAGGVKQVAARLGKSKTQLYRYTDEDSSAFTLDQARDLTRAGNLEFVFDLCALAGGGFMPGMPMGNASLAQLAGKCATGSAEVVADVLTLPAGPMTRTAAIRLLRELQDIDRISAALKARIMADMQKGFSDE